MPEYDARLTPAREDLAAAHLKDVIRAPRYAEGRIFAVGGGVAALRANPSTLSRLETQVLFGEQFTVYDEKDGWAWGQCALDFYVGYVDATALVPQGAAATHRVSARFSQIYSAGEVKSPALTRLPMNAKLAVTSEDGKFARLAGGGFVPRSHILPLGEIAPDFVSIAEELLGTPYLWGGRSPDGIDCSGLVQSALERCGVNAPRDSDMQERALGQEVAGGVSAALQRGDLVFWSDHVGIMCDAETLLHANSHRMMVARESLAAVAARNEAAGSRVTSVRRLTSQ
jgi:cell wall-associated NlpC family hydrolase